MSSSTNVGNFKGGTGNFQGGVGNFQAEEFIGPVRVVNLLTGKRMVVRVMP